MEQDPAKLSENEHHSSKSRLGSSDSCRSALVTCNFCRNLCEQFGEFEIMAKHPSATQEYRTATTCKIKKETRADESTTTDHILTGSKTFCVDVFLVIIDILISML